MNLCKVPPKRFLPNSSCLKQKRLGFWFDPILCSEWIAIACRHESFQQTYQVVTTGWMRRDLLAMGKFSVGRDVERLVPLVLHSFIALSVCWSRYGATQRVQSLPRIWEISFLYPWRDYLCEKGFIHLRAREQNSCLQFPHIVGLLV